MIPSASGRTGPAAAPSAEEPTEEPARESAEDPAGEPARELAEDPAGESAEEPAREPAENPAGESAEEPAGELAAAGAGVGRSVRMTMERRWPSSPAARKEAWPAISSAAAGSTKRRSSNRPRRNLSRRMRRTETSMRDSPRRPRSTNSMISSGHCSPPSWSAPASMILRMRAGRSRCSTPQARAGIGVPMISASVTRPQSVQTTPSKPYRCRSSPSITARLKPKPTSSYVVSTGIP